MSVKEKFIQNLIQELNNITYNEVKYEGNNPPIDVPYVVSIIDQQIENYKEFMEDITNNTYCINGYERDNTGGYTKGKIRILIENPEEDAYYNYYYYIEFLHDERMWRYCQCEHGDNGYNEKYQCCGDGCDWYAPAFRLIKEIELGCSSWEGQEKDYWEYIKKFEANEQNNHAEVEKLIKEQQKRDLEIQIKKLQNELEALEC